ncbi:MAG: GGDEF domain-containing protein [Oscillospiraceae bacterium]
MWEHIEETKVEAIQKSYRRLNEKWLHIHYYAMAYLTLFACVMEILMFFVLTRVGVISIPGELYLLRYLAMPVGVNLSLVGFCFLIQRSRRCSSGVKIYAISLSFVTVAFVLYSVHNVFRSLYLLFVIPLVLTAVYGDLLLTTLIAALSLLGKVSADLLVRWDPKSPNVLGDSILVTDFFLSLLFLVVFYAVCVLIIRIEREKNNVSIQKEQERLRLREKTITDELTGIPNRVALREAFIAMEHDETAAVYWLAMLDVDNFKGINDTQGHQNGDSYLRELGTVLSSACGTARPFRFGGDEFCILFHNATREMVLQTCQAVQTDYAQQLVALELAAATLSIGAARYHNGEPPSELLKYADVLLYRAKEKRGAVLLEPPEAAIYTTVAVDFPEVFAPENPEEPADAEEDSADSEDASVDTEEPVDAEEERTDAETRQDTAQSD